MTIFDRFFDCAQDDGGCCALVGAGGEVQIRNSKQIRNTNYQNPKPNVGFFLRFCFDVVLYPRFYGDKFKPAKAEVLRVSRGKKQFCAGKLRGSAKLDWTKLFGEANIRRYEKGKAVASCVLRNISVIGNRITFCSA